MPNEIEPTEPLDPAATLRQAAGLAEHLQRIGAQWLPTVNAENARSLSAQFQFAGEQPLEPSSTPGPAPNAAPANAASLNAASANTASPDDGGHAPPPGATVERPVATPAPFSLNGDAAAGAAHYPGPSRPAADRATQLASYAEQVTACTRCEILSKCRTKTVFGEGNVSPRVVFFGEGPGRDEDLSGRPFVGKAGQLLTKMIEACKFAREDVYIMNTVKCRPPNNRNPEPTEIENCREYFEAQLNVLRPEYIVCLGLVSAQALLKTKLSVGRMRGKFHQYFDSKTLVTYHPSYLLRTPAAKKAAWDDLQLMLRDAGLL